jgi:molybdopterin-synthase adenylyltransferase
MNHQRNLGILTEEEQSVLTTKRVAILGVGLGSVVAELALRTGFSSLLLVDGDTVSETNLNRQRFTEADVGKSKVLCTRNYLRAIAPKAKIAVVDAYLAPGEVAERLGDTDLVVDSIDLSSIDTILAVHEWARAKGVPVVFPMNLIWKSMVTVFDEQSETLEQLLCVDDHTRQNVQARDFGFWAQFLGRHVSLRDQPGYARFVSRSSRMKDWCPAPQLGLTATVTASLVVKALVNLALGRSVPRAPQMAALDLGDVMGEV